MLAGDKKRCRAECSQNADNVLLTRMPFYLLRPRSELLLPVNEQATRDMDLCRNSAVVGRI